MNPSILGIGLVYGLHKEGLSINIQIAPVHIQIGCLGVVRLSAFRQGEEHEGHLVVLPDFLIGGGLRQIGAEIVDAVPEHAV